MKRLLITILGVLAVGTCVYGISYDANTDGTSAPAGATFIPTGGGLVTKSQFGWTVLGVQGGTPGEISLNESIQIHFASSQHFNTITLGLLFDGTEYNDHWEIAAMTANGTDTFTLQAISLNTASWNGLGSVINLSPSDDQHAAVWQITNPFGDFAVSDLLLYPMTSNPGGNESDFGLQAFSTPDGGTTLTLLGAAFAMLGAFGRKFRK